MNEQERARAIIKDLKEVSTLQLYASDGTGVRPLNDLLSTDHLREITKVVINCLREV